MQSQERGYKPQIKASQAKGLKLGDLLLINQAKVQKIRSDAAEKNHVIKIIKSHSKQNLETQFSDHFEMRLPTGGTARPHKRSLTNTPYQQEERVENLRLEALVSPTGNKTNRQFFPKAKNSPPKEEFEEKVSFIRPKTGANANQNFFVDIFSNDLAEELESRPAPKKNDVLSLKAIIEARSMRSSNSSTTLKGLPDAHKFAAEKGGGRGEHGGNYLLKDGVLENETLKTPIGQQKYFKSAVKCPESDPKALVFSNQVKKQFQFMKEDEEEEINFRELCNALEAGI